MPQPEADVSTVATIADTSYGSPVTAGRGGGGGDRRLPPQLGLAGSASSVGWWPVSRERRAVLGSANLEVLLIAAELGVVIHSRGSEMRPRPWRALDAPRILSSPTPRDPPRSASPAAEALRVAPPASG